MRKTAKNRTDDSRAGFTLLEVIVSVAILTIVFGASLILVLRSTEGFDQQMREYTLDQAGWLAMDHIAQDAVGAEPTTLLPAIIADSPWVSYQKITGYDPGPGVVILGPVTTIDVQPMPGEAINGVDDNGDGRVDEGFVTITEAGSPPVQVAGHVVGLRFNSTVAGLKFDIDIAVVDRDGSVAQKTYSREVRFRN